MGDRRRFLQSLSFLPSWAFLGAPAAAGEETRALPDRDYFKELGVAPIINGAGTFTRLTASLMPPEVVRAIEYAARHYVRLEDLHDRVGERIAAFLGCEAAMVPSGAAAALTLGTAACLTGTDPDRIKRLPDTTGMKNEVIVQKSHRNGYDHAVRACGAKLVEVETAEELERAVNEKTAFLMFFNAWDTKGQIKVVEFAALGKKHGVPTFIDAAADVPPVENLSRFPQLGYDLVAISGGKGISGPQSAGLLLGRKDLIQAARLNTSPNSDSIGRGLKVSKEELLGMLVALELYLKRDHRAEWLEWEKRIQTMADTLKAVPGVTTEAFVPEIANHVPHLRIRWDESVIKKSSSDVVHLLREGSPSIEFVPTPSVAGSLEVASWMLQPGEAETVARCIASVLSST